MDEWVFETAEDEGDGSAGDSHLEWIRDFMGYGVRIAVAVDGDCGDFCVNR